LWIAGAKRPSKKADLRLKIGEKVAKIDEFKRVSTPSFTQAIDSICVGPGFDFVGKCRAGGVGVGYQAEICCLWLNFG
jgi:hypothetical protein